MPLRVDLSIIKDEWVPFGEVKPNDPPGSMSNNLPNGGRELIIFSCARDDSHSKVERSPENLDLVKGPGRTIWNTHTELIATLRDGESHEMEIHTDRGVRSQLRITHTKAMEQVRVLHPKEVLLGAFEYLQRDTLFFSDLLTITVASVWVNKEGKPPSDLIDRMQSALKRILEQMVAEGTLTVSNGSSGQKAYTRRRKS